jgi:hypothetical protein
MSRKRGNAKLVTLTFAIVFGGKGTQLRDGWK